MTENLRISNLIKDVVVPGFTAAPERVYADKINRERGKEYPYTNATKGRFFPNKFLKESLTRTLSTLTATAGGNLVSEPSQPEHGEVLVEDVVNELGISYAFGLKGEPSIPDVTLSAIAIQGEGEAATPNNTVITNAKKLTPNFLRVKVSLTRDFTNSLNETSELLIRNAITQAMHERVLYFVFNGAGSGSNEPLGLLNDADIVSVDGSAFTRTKALAIVKASQTAKAKRNKAWVTNPTNFETLASKQVEAGTGIYLIDNNLKMTGFPVYETNQVSGTNAVFGHFPSVLVGVWGDDIDVFVVRNPSANDGGYLLIAEMFFDVAFRNKSQFRKITSIS